VTSTLDAPRPVAQRYGLLSVPGVLPEERRLRWANGVNTFGFPTQMPWTWDPCSEGTFRVKSEESDISSERFDPFGIGLTVTCSRLGAPADLRDRLRAAFDATLSWAVERAVSQGSEVTSNGSLGDTNLTILGGGAVTPDVGLSWLENSIGEKGVRGIIHAPSPVVSAWGFEKVRVEGDHLVSPNGNFVAAGGGYIGADPAAGTSPAAGQSWAFATAGLEVRLTEPTIVGNEAESLDRALNDLVFRVESTALATWDAEVVQAGVLIDWTP
jgi:hypothetical protein